MATKNLGQVAGLWIGTSAPTNTTLIWFDSTPAIRCHKVYNVSLSAWVVLDQSVISAITYSELRNLARGTGLTQGSWYKITDQGNILALAITSTKVQYTDTNSNFVIDDLAASATYVVNSSNLLIDDLAGVWDATNKKIKFNFAETTHDGNTDNDYLFGKKQRGGVWSLAKYKMSQLVSAVTGNSISWNKGIFFNFTTALNAKKDVSGGVVSKETHDSDKAALQQSVDNTAGQIASTLVTAKSYTDDKVTNAQIYGKQLPSAPTSGTATDIVANDTLSGIITKIQRWINQFKYATGMKVSASFAPSASVQQINNNDTVDSALRKVQKSINEISSIANGEYIKTGQTDVVVPSSEPSAITKNDTVKQSIQKLIYWVTHITTARLVDESVTLAKIARVGILPTDIFRVDLTTNFSMANSGLGCVLVQGQSNNFFTYDPYHPNCPYRLRVFYNSAFPKILGFCPVFQCVDNAQHEYSAATSFVHFTAEGVTCQVMIQFSDEAYSALYTTSGYRYLKGQISANVYGATKSPVDFSIALNKVNVLSINFSQSSLNEGWEQHIVLSINCTASETS